MSKLLLNIVMSILPKLVDKLLTPANIEKYSDRLFDVCRRGLLKVEDDQVRELLLDIIDILDENIGE